MESVIFSIMREEYQRLAQAEQTYALAIESLPRGAPRVKQIRKGEYLYLAHRVGPRVVYDYVGPLRSEKAQQVLDQVEKRKRLGGLLKEVRQGLKDVKKVLRGKI